MQGSLPRCVGKKRCLWFHDRLCDEAPRQYGVCSFGNMKGELVKSRFVAAEVARDVRYDVHTRTPALKALKMILSLAATRDGKRRPCSVALHDIVAAFVHATIHEVVAVLPPDGLLERVLPPVEGTLRHSKGFETVAAALHESAQEIRMGYKCGNGWDIPPSRSCKRVRLRGGRLR